MSDESTRWEKLLKHPKFKILLLVLLFVLLLVYLIAEYMLTVRIVNISQTKDLDARGGEIRITYNKKITRSHYREGEGLAIKRVATKKRDTEIIKLVKPTKYNKAYHLIQLTRDSDYFLFPIFRGEKSIPISTGIEQVQIKSMIPSEKSIPSPESMENQLVLQFQGEVRGAYKTGVNIPAEEMSFVKLTPNVRGYYQWSDDSTLTFNFTEDRPQFETKYEFEVYPEKMLRPEYQKWVGEKTTASITTSINDVYVVDISVGQEVNWLTPLRIEFSGNMVGALDVLKKKDQSLVPIDIRPKAGGVWVWVNARTIEFQPDNKLGWPIRETMTIEVKPGINRDPDRKWRDDAGLSKFSFYVLPRKQSIRSYNLRGDHVVLDESLVVDFSRDLVSEGLVGQTLSGNIPASEVPLKIEPAVKGSFIWARRDRLKFKPENLWSELTEYKISLNPGFNPDPRYEWEGTKDFKFKTVENVVNVDFFFTPENRISASKFFSDKFKYAITQKIPPESRLWINFDKELGQHIDETTNLYEAVKIKPSIEGKFTWLSNSLLEFHPNEHWQENKDYEVKLDKRLLHHPEQHFREYHDQLGFQTIEDTVAYSFPGTDLDDGNIRLDPDKSLRVAFSKNMKPLIKVGRSYLPNELPAEQKPFTLEPSLDMEFRWETNREFIIRPTSYWKPDTRYQLTLNRNILPHQQADFQGDGKLVFKSNQNYVKISKFTPIGRVGRRIIIDAVFDKSIKPIDIKINEADTANLFTINPKLTGQWVWLADNKIQFIPKEPLLTSTTYEVTFDPNNIVDKQFTWHKPRPEGQEHYKLEKYFIFTENLYVTKSKARFEFNEKDILKQRFFLDIELSADVEEKQLRRHFTIWYEKFDESSDKTINVPLTYTLQVEKSNIQNAIKKFSVVSDWIERPANDRRIHYQIKSGLQPVVGDRELISDYKSYFLQEKPKYVKLKRVEWHWKDGRYKAVVALNAPIDPKKLKSFLSVYDIDKVDMTAIDTQKNNNGMLEYNLEVESSRNQSEFKYAIASGFTPGGKYSFSIDEGLLAADGAFTAEQEVYESKAPDLKQKLAFAYDGNVLSRADLKRVAIVTSNIDSFYVKVEKIFDNNVSYFINNNLSSSNINKIAKVVYHQIHDAEDLYNSQSGRIKNKELITHIDLSALLRDNVHGLHRISISRNASGYGANQANRRWFLATDMGLIARRFDRNMVVWANSLQNLQAKGGVRVKVIDAWNQVIGAGTTDYNGFARIQLRADSQPQHVTAELGDDFSFLDMRKHRDRLIGHDVSGVGSKESTVRTFIYSDRGVYRPGDTVHLVAVSRANAGQFADSDIAVNLSLVNPTGKEIVTEKYSLGIGGVFSYDFKVPAESKTGKWNATVKWNNKNTGNYTFQIEEFIPNKIKVELEQTSQDVAVGETLKFNVKAKNLFGPPASGLNVSANVSLRPHYFKPKGYSLYAFGHDDSDFQRIDESLTETKLDQNGMVEYEFQIPDGIDSPIGLNAHYSATVLDDGGRGVSSYQQTNVLLYSQFVGIKRLNTAAVDINGQIGFEIVNVDAQGHKIPAEQQQLSAKIFYNKRVTHYRKNERGYYRYVTEHERTLVEELDDPRDEEGKFYYQPTVSGEHILEVTDDIGRQVTRFKFEIRGERSSVDRVEAADRVELAVMTQKSEIGDVLELEVKTPFPGKVLLTGERERILFTRVLNMSTTRQVISLPVEKKHFPNFYISAMAIKPVNQGDRHNPVYATGLLNVNIDDPDQTPSITLNAPARANPNSKIKIDLKVDDINPMGRMNFTIAAVDVGILDLTKFELPNMKGYFNEKRKLEVNHYNLYPMIMPYETEAKAVIDPSGDAPSRALIKKKRVNPDSQQRVKSVALWSGVLQTDEYGQGSIEFDLPDFDGSLKIMAVAFGNKRFASAQKEIVIRDKLVMKPTLPRFLSADDDFILPVKLFNGTEIGGLTQVMVIPSDHVNVLGSSSKTVYIEQNDEQELDFALKVNNELGLAQIELVAEGVGEQTRKLIKIPVRSPGTLVTHSDAGRIDELTPKTINLPVDFKEGTQNLAMRITSNRLVRYQNALSYLLRYPHGCLEQTTSKAFPLLYYHDMAMSAGKIFSSEKTPKYYAREAVKKIERMQLENGGFSYWEGRDTIHNWSFVYSSHFMVEAKSSGLKVNDDVWNNMVFYLNQLVNQNIESNYLYRRSYGITHMLYALYVLALAEENVLSKLNYIFDTYYENLKAHDKARLAAAFTLSGDKDTGKKIIKDITGFSAYDEPYRDTGGAFSSSVRDLAIILDALVVIDSKSTQIPVLIDLLSTKSRYGRWSSTQENAFAFLAIGKAAANSEAVNTNADIRLGDGQLVPFERNLLLKTPELLKGDVRIEVRGDGELSYSWEAVGIEKNPSSLQKDEGLEIRRRFLDKNGEVVDLASVKQGDLLVAEIKVQSLGQTLENVVITDLLPSGLEIENTRLSTSASIPWIKPTAKTDYVDIRDDRISIFLTVPTSERVYYYTTRAVTVGNYTIPSIHAEAMYDPEKFSESGRGQLKILPREGNTRFALKLN